MQMDKWHLSHSRLVSRYALDKPVPWNRMSKTDELDVFRSMYLHPKSAVQSQHCATNVSKCRCCEAKFFFNHIIYFTINPIRKSGTNIHNSTTYNRKNQKLRQLHH